MNMITRGIYRGSLSTLDVSATASKYRLVYIPQEYYTDEVLGMLFIDNINYELVVLPTNDKISHPNFLILLPDSVTCARKYYFTAFGIDSTSYPTKEDAHLWIVKDTSWSQ